MVGENMSNNKTMIIYTLDEDGDKDTQTITDIVKIDIVELKG